MATLIRHKFAVGNSYDTYAPKSTSEYLDAALEAEKYIAQYERQTKDGIFWSIEETDKPNLSFFVGTTGNVYYYLKLYQALGGDEYLDKVKKGADYLTKHWQDDIVEGKEDIPGASKGLYYGIGGIGLVLLDIYDETKEEKYLDTARDIAKYYKDHASKDENGIYWSNSSALFLDGGTILFLLKLYEEEKSDEIYDLIISAIKHYLAGGIKHDDGGLEFNGLKGWLNFSLPNFEFGSAGSGYLLTKIYELTNEEQYLDAAKACAIYLKSIAIKQEKGFLVPYRVGLDEEPIFYLSSCHGPAGTSRLFYRLYKLTNDDKYLKDIEELVDGLESTGAPEKQSVGFWNNVCLCCGNAGLVQFFTAYYQASKSDRYKKLALRAGNVLLGEKEKKAEKISHWPLAFTRVEPETITSPIGYYDGAAGIGSALLQLYLSEEDKFKWVRLYDDPFNE
ncbi:MAG: hypothetical protein MJ112_04180 [Lachnospiraceae bacterium]|nr:hypothetical protein [Lachnospiraceae bacterium]